MSIVTIQAVEDGEAVGDITYFELPEGVSGGVRRIGRRRGKKVKASEEDFAKIQQAEQERLERDQEKERIAFQKKVATAEEKFSSGDLGIQQLIDLVGKGRAKELMIERVQAEQTAKQIERELGTPMVEELFRRQALQRQKKADPRQKEAYKKGDITKKEYWAGLKLALEEDVLKKKAKYGDITSKKERTLKTFLGDFGKDLGYTLETLPQLTALSLIGVTEATGKALKETREKRFSREEYLEGAKTPEYFKGTTQEYELQQLKIGLGKAGRVTGELVAETLERPAGVVTTALEFYVGGKILQYGYKGSKVFLKGSKKAIRETLYPLEKKAFDKKMKAWEKDITLKDWEYKLPEAIKGKAQTTFRGTALSKQELKLMLRDQKGLVRIESPFGDLGQTKLLPSELTAYSVAKGRRVTLKKVKTEGGKTYVKELFEEGTLPKGDIRVEDLRKGTKGFSDLKYVDELKRFERSPSVLDLKTKWKEIEGYKGFVVTEQPLVKQQLKMAFGFSDLLKGKKKIKQWELGDFDRALKGAKKTDKDYFKKFYEGDKPPKKKGQWEKWTEEEELLKLGTETDKIGGKLKKASGGDKFDYISGEAIMGGDVKLQYKYAQRVKPTGFEKDFGLPKVTVETTYKPKGLGDIGLKDLPIPKETPAGLVIPYKMDLLGEKSISESAFRFADKFDVTTRIKQEQDQDQLSDLKLGSVQEFDLGLKSSLRSFTELKRDFKSEVDIKTELKQETKLGLKLDLKQETDLKLGFDLGFSLPLQEKFQFDPLKTKRPKRTTKKRRVFAKGVGLKKGKGAEAKDGYKVETRKKGKFTTLTRNTYSKQDAFDLGATAVDNSADASFRITKTDQKAKKKFKAPTRTRQKFRAKKTASGVVYIEKRKYRIDTFGERMGISAKGWYARSIGAKKKKKKTGVFGL